jgi:hypothetical protein
MEHHGKALGGWGARQAMTYDLWVMFELVYTSKYYLSLKLVEYISLLTAFKEGDR